MISSRAKLPLLQWLCVFSFISIASCADELRYVIPFVEPKNSNASDFYYQKLIHLALEKSAVIYGPAALTIYPTDEGKERQRALIRSNLGLDVVWSATSPVREEQMLAVRINLLRQLSDYKILLIRCSDKEKFAQIKSLHDLNRFVAGTGQHWQDAKVLLANDIKFVSSWNYESLFKMLAAGRFDYMVRGAQEIWSEIDNHKNFGFCAEERLLLHYTLPIYYFVNKENRNLAERIRVGLEMAEKDGSWMKLFLSTPGFEQALKTVKDKNRLIIELPRVPTN